eukprot:NODE_13707_length_1151_cov_5.130859.p1 GENE.NODE_13707_length_1151_cov_5.130859~~NODE_13707_length_1151_cov_5.130859.p1  ORF type:complete len:240 (-),score=54.28 NODE_13707_length_1151_cov_5.130859:303-1022(-)
MHGVERTPAAMATETYSTAAIALPLFDRKEIGTALRHHLPRGRCAHGAHKKGGSEDPCPKVDGKKAATESHWVAVGGGFLSARRAPARTGSESMYSWDATVVVTLLGPEEGVMTDQVKAAADGLGIHWMHAPLMPIANTNPVTEEDDGSFLQAREALRWLNQGEKVAVHCQAGCHRTGSFCYVVLRLAGHTQDEALKMLWQTRELTGEEFEARTSNRPKSLVPKAEAVFQRLFLGIGNA